MLLRPDFLSSLFIFEYSGLDETHIFKRLRLKQRAENPFPLTKFLLLFVQTLKQIIVIFKTGLH